MAIRQIYSDEEFMRWCESFKPCKRCNRMFVGPVCECERPITAARVPQGGRR